MINITNFGDFLNCTVLEYLLEYVSSIPLYSEMLEPYSSNLKTRLASECTVYKNLIQNHVKKLKYSWLLLVHEYLNSVGPSCTILSGIPHPVSRMHSRQEIKSTRSAYKEGLLTVLHFERDLQITISVDFSDFLKLWRQKPRGLKV